MNLIKNPKIFIPTLMLSLIVIIAGAIIYFRPTQGERLSFDGAQALRHVQTQVDFGPRTPGSAAHDQIVTWMSSELTTAGWEVDIQETSFMQQPIRNVVAKRGGGKPWLILGAHYDSRLIADQDPDPAKRELPVPGANDGASGVAVLVELARVLPKDLEPTVWLVFFDAEDNGQIPGWDWILGSQAFADQLGESIPDAVVIIDMIGDADLNIHRERNSNPEITTEIWDQAQALGHDDVFLPTPKFSMLDDHTPFLKKGIAAIDIIDFDYPYWHTTADTADKVSAESLAAVGETLYHWIISR